MNFRKTARRMISDWYKNKKRAADNSPKNETQEKQLAYDMYYHGLVGVCGIAHSATPPKEAKLATEKYDKRMEAVIESIANNPSMGDHFAYFNASPLCGSCGMAMCQEATHYEPGSNIKLRIRCLNWACSHNGILYEVLPEKSAVIVMRRVDERS